MKKGIENRVIALDALTPHQRNYNRHSAAQIADLRESLKQFGQVRSIVVQADKAGKRYTAVAGHGIAEAARAEGYTELRADVIPHNWSDARVLAYLAADNELARHGDPDQEQLAAIVRDVMAAEGEALARLAAGEQAALDAILNAGNATDETADVGELVDKAAELQKKWNVARGDVWEIGKHRLMCGDSTSAEDVAALMQGEQASMFITDPPYGVGYEYATHNDNDENAYFDLCKGFMQQALTLGCFGVVTVGHKHNNWWFETFNPDSFLIWYDKTKQSPHKIAYLCKTELILNLS